MRQIVETLQDIKGKQVDIYTDHKLFGKQHVAMEFEPETEIGLGFKCKGQTIYIDNNDIIDYSIENNVIVIDGKLMCIKIVKSI